MGHFCKDPSGLGLPWPAIDGVLSNQLMDGRECQNRNARKIGEVEK